jgi:hypothetical protein
MVGVGHGFFSRFLSRYQPSNSQNTSTITWTTEAARTDAHAREREERKKNKRINNFSSLLYFSYITSRTAMLVAYFKVLFRGLFLEMPKVATKPLLNTSHFNLTTHPQFLFFSLTILSNEQRTVKF